MKPVMKWIAAVSVLMSGAAQAEPVTLDIWTIDRPDQYMYLLKDEFEQSHPDIKLNIKTVQFRDMVNDLARATATGESPDVTYIDNPEVALFASRGLLLDLSPMLAQLEGHQEGRYFPRPTFLGHLGREDLWHSAWREYHCPLLQRGHVQGEGP